MIPALSAEIGTESFDTSLQTHRYANPLSDYDVIMSVIVHRVNLGVNRK
jgi:hypothetical protein